MRLTLLPLLALAAIPSTLAYPQITYPAAGQSVPAGAITVKWTDDGTAPTISQLSTFTLTLYVGGNTPGTNANSVVAVGTMPGKFSAGNQITGTIDPSLTAALTNGFYLQMVATAKTGTVTLYSSRFSLAGMTGPAQPAAIRSAVTALGGSTVGPPDVNAVAAAPVAPAVPPAATVPVGGAVFNTPYPQQQGLTKYAPMQGIPPNKISLRGFTPLFPTSAFTVAKTWLPRPSIVTTVTEVQTFSVHSQVNTAAAQSQPTGNAAVQRFLARWKD